MIKCEETATKSEETIAELVRAWESSVRATHLFLSESVIDRIKGYVPQVRHLLVDSAGKVNGNFGIRTKNVCKNHVFGTNASQKVVKGAKSRRRRKGRQRRIEKIFLFDVQAAENR